MPIVQRTATHITDTRSIRLVASLISEDWLVRGLEERDYGVDLTLEFFDGDKPKGQFALVQVKGTIKNFGDPVTLYDFPVKTAEYAKEFDIPFFVFYVSLADEEVYFVWLQECLRRDGYFTATNGNLNIQFPEENTLTDNKKKIETILDEESASQQGIIFIAKYEWLKRHIDAALSELDVTFIGLALDVLDDIENLERLFAIYDTGNLVNLNPLRFNLADAKSSLAPGDEDTEAAKQSLLHAHTDFTQSQLDFVREAFLSRDETRQSQVEMTGEATY